MIAVTFVGCQRSDRLGGGPLPRSRQPAMRPTRGQGPGVVRCGRARSGSGVVPRPSDDRAIRPSPPRGSASASADVAEAAVLGHAEDDLGSADPGCAVSDPDKVMDGEPVEPAGVWLVVSQPWAPASMDGPPCGEDGPVLGLFPMVPGSSLPLGRVPGLTVSGLVVGAAAFVADGLKCAAADEAGFEPIGVRHGAMVAPSALVSRARSGWGRGRAAGCPRAAPAPGGFGGSG